MGDPIVGNPPGPGHQIAEIEGQRFPSGFPGDHAELVSHVQQLHHERLSEARIIRDLVLPFGPRRNGRAVGEIARLPCTDRLQGSQPMGEQTQMVPLQGGQQGALQLRQLALREHLH